MIDFPHRPLKVFLCHASQDKPVVRELYNALKSENWIDPWLDKAKILPGQDWEMVIEKAVDNSDVVIVCISNSSVTKEGFVQREIRYAYDIALEKPEDTIFLIPLRLDDCNVPRKLRTLHWVDYFGIEKENAYFNLLGALKLRYEQKMQIESEELAHRRAEEKKQQRSDELTRKVVAEKVADEKAKIESIEKTALEKAEIMQRQKSQRRMERYIKEGAKEYERKEKIEKFVDQIFDWASVNIRLFGISGVILFVLILGGFGLNYLLKFKNMPIATATVSFLLNTETPEPSTSTNVPSTLTPTSQQIGTPVLGIGSTMIGKDDMTLLYVPAGEFTMGSDNGESNEKPVHKVDLNAYWIDKTEATNKMYSLCVKAGVCKEPVRKNSNTNSNYYGNSKFDYYPVVYVDWSMAKTYCEWVDRRLLTEAEWEKAARGIDGSIYPWGNDIPNSNLLNYNNVVRDTTKVGSYSNSFSPYGVFDMAGNVWEWVNDWYSDAYYDSSPLSNPPGPLSGTNRVLRGGSWLNGNYIMRSSYRYGYNPTSTSDYLGFRCAMSVNP